MREPTRVIALRHGRTAWNADQRVQGHADIPLDAVGREQAVRVARALADEPIAAVYSSDLQRACETAQPLARLRGVPVQTDRALRERCFGRFEGSTFAEIEQRWPEDAARWRRREPAFEPGGGESLEVFFARCVRAMAGLAARHPGESIAIVAHGGVLDCLYRAAAHIELAAPRTWQLGNASINRLLHTGERFVVVGWNDDAHLAALA